MKPTLLCSALLLHFAVEAAGQQDSVAADQARFKRWLDFYAAEAATYELFLSGQPDRKLTLQTAPLLTYTNPVRTGGQHGAVYVWTLDGRPAAIGSIWSTAPAGEGGRRSVSHEFQSLSSQPIASRHAPRVGRRGPVPDWRSRTPGIELREVAGAAAPAATPTARLIQMRRLAKEFSAQITVSDDEPQSDLRLLTQPLFRYSSSSAGAIDGGLFAYVQATDPELILILETRETSAGPRWHYAAARFTNLPLRLKRGDEEAWSCDKAVAYVGDKPYFLYWGVSQHDQGLADLEQ